MLALWVLFFLLLTLLGLSVFYLGRFVRIIMILEDDFSEAVEILQDADATLEALLEQPMFFDSPEVRALVVNAMEGVKASKVSVAGLVRKFTQRSKQKWIREEIEEQDRGERS